MKKINYLVLMAAMLLVGTNAWAQNTISVVYHNGETPAASFSDLQTAINSVAPGDSATITLSATQLLNKGIVIPNVMSAASEAEKIVNRAGQRICIDLHGYDIKTSTMTKNSVFSLLKGTLRFTGEGKIERANVARGSSNWERGAIVVSGTDGRDASLGIDAEHPDRSKQEWSVLYIDEYVEVISEYDDTYGIGIQELGNTFPSWGTSKDAWGYKTFYTGTTASGSEESAPMWTKNASKQQYSAFGVKLMIAGTVYGHTRGINVLGSINQTPRDCEGHTARTKDTYPYYDRNYPYINIMSTADVSCIDQGVKENGNGGIYAGGWAVLDISGAVHGQTGVFMKSGDVRVIDGNVYSDAPTAENSGNYHGDVSGSGIFIASDKGYAGETSVSIEGDSRVAGAGGSAIVDVIATNTTETQVSHVTITGGTIEGGDQGAINITTSTSEQTEVTGGSVAGTITVGAVEGEGGTVVDVSTLIPDNEDFHTTIVVDEETGKTTVVISQGAAPAGDANVAEGHNADSRVKWTGTSENITTDLVLKELEINEATVQTLTIKTGKSLTVGRVVLGVNARIIVEPGAKFIVGESGIVAPSVDNILLQTSADNPAIFLCHPNATVGRHPNATVEFISKSFTDGGNYAKQRFGIPTNGELTSITTKYNNGDVQTALSKFDYEGNKWVDFGWINIGGKEANLDQMKKPFDYYQMQHNTPNMGTIVTMKGSLVGNDNPVLNVREKFWNGFANSYMGPINGAQLMEMIPNTVDKAIYMYDVTTNQATWEPVTLIDMEDTEILPMQPFLIRNTMAAANVTINYGNAVYYPTTGESPSHAPVRSSVLNDMTKVKLVVKGEDCIDRVIVAEGDQFSDDFDNGYDAAKYMNEGINMYVTSSEKMSIFATDNLENTYVGLQTIKGGAYSIEFSKVQGEDLTLIDLETGASVAMTEGNVYTFTAVANTTNDYRFLIVRAKKVATDVESVEAQKNANGIYTIMGQYVGEMNLWNSLPAGVYVVNGKKLVK